ncbi:mitochondrial outer membrane protein porin 4, partial [Tanacetum coccineum]
VGQLRCWPGSLCLLRSIGDTDAGEFIVPIPPVKQVKLSNSGGTIIIAFDCIWNALTSDMVAQCCRSWLSLKKDLDVQYLHPRIAIYSSMGLNPSTVLNVAATVGNKDVILGGEVGFDTAFASFTKYTAGISFKKSNISASLLL